MGVVRVTLTNRDIETLLEALDNLDQDVKNYEGAMDPYRLEIQAVDDKLQNARKRLK